MNSKNAAVSLGDLAVFNATQAAPPGMPEQAAGPQGLGTATQSKLVPTFFCKLPICQLPASTMTTLPLMNSSMDDA